MACVEKPFWLTKKLTEMTREQWEALCDRCGRCCVHKLENEDTGEIYYTNVSCALLDTEQCQCKLYHQRNLLVPDCAILDPVTIESYQWLPPTCAYRLLAEGRPLEWWHPLVSKDPSTVHQAGISIHKKLIPEHKINLEQLEDHIVPEPL